MPSYCFTTAVAFYLIISVSPAFAQTYDFDDETDIGWEHLDPLVEAGASPGTFAFRNGGYHLKREASPSPEEMGVARIGSFLPGVMQDGDFYIRVDVTDWDEDEDQNIGILSMITDPGLGTTNGYTLTLDTSEQSLYLAIVDLEVPGILTNTPLAETVTPDSGFRLIFQRVDDEITGDIFALTDLEESLATVEGFDDFFETGSPGIIVSVDPNDGAIDATFDNFSLAAEGTETIGIPPDILHTEVTAETVRVLFGPADANAEYQLQGSTDLQSWLEIVDGFEPGASEGTGVFRFPRPEGQKLSFYRIGFPAP